MGWFGLARIQRVPAGLRPYNIWEPLCMGWGLTSRETRGFGIERVEEPRGAAKRFLLRQVISIKHINTANKHGFNIGC